MRGLIAMHVYGFRHLERHAWPFCAWMEVGTKFANIPSCEPFAFVL